MRSWSQSGADLFGRNLPPSSANTPVRVGPAQHHLAMVKETVQAYGSYSDRAESKILKGCSKIPVHLFRNFPSGMAGVGLFLLRVITALALGWTGYSLLYDSAEGAARGWSLPYLVGTLLPLLGIMMIAGFATALSGILACGFLVISFVWLGLPRDGQSATAAGLSLVLTLVGPGSYSLDARLFGWRHIEIERRKRSKS